MHISICIKRERERRGERKRERFVRERFVDIAMPCEITQASGLEACDIYHIRIT